MGGWSPDGVDPPGACAQAPIIMLRAKPKVRLIAWTTPAVGKDPRRLVVLAAKVSQGRLRRKPAEHYLTDYRDDLVGRWLLEAAKRFPVVLEHISFTFLIEGISRVCSHQLVRHRLASYAQESQRYSAQHPEVVLPETVKDKGFEREFLDLCAKAHELYRRMCEAGVPPEDARFVLPQAFTTTILMTVNLRELLHIAKLRLAPEAQWEIREVVHQMIEEASRVVPEVKFMVKEATGDEASS